MLEIRVVVGQRGVVPAVGQVTRESCRQHDVHDARILGVLVVHQALQQPWQMPCTGERVLQLTMRESEHEALRGSTAQADRVIDEIADLGDLARRMQPQHQFGEVVQQRRDDDLVGLLVVTPARDRTGEGRGVLRPAHDPECAIQRDRVLREKAFQRCEIGERPQEFADAVHHHDVLDSRDVGQLADRAIGLGEAQCLQRHQRITKHDARDVAGRDPVFFAPHLP